MKQPIISICIPTNGAVKWVMPTLSEVYMQNVDLSLFDVVVADNGENCDLEEKIKSFNYPNLYYVKTNDKGFLNLITALKLGKGLYHKMLNHRSILTKGALQNWIDLIERYKDDKPVIYCSNGDTNEPDIIECRNFDEFVYQLNYVCTWSGGIGIWDVDVNSMDKIAYNPMFPNTSLLFEHRKQGKYIIYKKKFETQQSGVGKGCYNLFHTFAVVFPDMLIDLRNRNRISGSTYDKVMKDLYLCLQNFYLNFVLRSPDKSFDLTDTHKSITTYYSELDYWRLMYHCYKQYYYKEKFRHNVHVMRMNLFGKR